MPEAQQRGRLFVLVKNEPQVDRHIAQHGGEQLVGFLAKAEYVAREITAGRFYKRPGKWCAWCDYLPVCAGDQSKISETLVQIR